MNTPRTNAALDWRSLLDRPGARWLLAKLATWHAGRSGATVEILHDVVWMHRIGDRYWADGHSFRYNRWWPKRWLEQARLHDALAREMWFHRYEPRAGDVIVDVGAGDGSDLPLFSQAVGPTGRVIAIEAHPRTFELLERTVARNGLTNVVCMQKAILDRAGTIAISDVDAHVSNSVLQSAGAAPSAGAITVEGCTLAEICRAAGVSRIDFLKMNIEGAERFAVHGLTSLLPRIRHVCVACHDFRADRGDGEAFRTRDVVVDFLRDHGFEVSTRDGHTLDSIRDHVWGVRISSPARSDIRAQESTFA